MFSQSLSNEIKLLTYSLIVSANMLTGIAVAGEEHSTTAEIKPLPMVASLAPGVSGFGMSVEALRTGNFTFFADLYEFSMRLSNDEVAKAIEKQDEHLPVPQKFDSLALSVGGRFYSDINDDAWYAGGALSVSRVSTTWVHIDEKIQEREIAIAPSYNVGYRWLWDNGLSVRLGAVGTILPHAIARRTVSGDGYSDHAREGEDLVGARKYDHGSAWAASTAQVGVGLDFGVGYTF